MPTNSPPQSVKLPPLWQQLQVTAAILLAVRQGRSATVELSVVDAHLRAGVQSLVFHVLRHFGQAQALRRLLVKKVPPAGVDALLCTSLALFCGEDLPYDGFVLVDQSVEAAKRAVLTKHQAGFVNGCLRRYLREADALQNQAKRDLSAKWNHPAWWIARLKEEYPGHWQKILQANNRHAPFTLRINALKTDVRQYQSDLFALNIESKVSGEFGLILQKPRPVQALPGFETGCFSVQDAAAQRAAPLLLSGLQPTSFSGPMRVLDACAAPGGKTAHLLEYACGVMKQSVEVTAIEVDVRRAERIHDTLIRLGLEAKVLVADASDVATWWDQQPFDAVLLDAPCTASGIVRRHPDVRWLRKESDIEQLAAIQKRLLITLWPLVRPGGRLLYCTCSVFHAEGQDQIQTFLAHNTDAQLLGSPGYLIPFACDFSATVPDNAGVDEDGFFFALLEKRHA